MSRTQVLTGLFAVVVIAALGWSFFALELTRDQQIGFLGAAFGSFVAAATALGVIEFQMGRESARVRKVVDCLLLDADTAAENYLKSTHADSMDQPASLEEFVGSMDIAIALALDHRHRGIGMARAAHALRAMEPMLAEIREEAGQLRLEVDGDTAEALAIMQSMISRCRGLLITR